MKSSTLSPRISGRWLAGVLVLVAVLAADAALVASAAGTQVSGKIVVVAAENEYGSMVAAIGGNRVAVTSLLQNPNTDPHEFEASASTAITLSKAKLVIKNGIGYDSWVDKLLSASPRSGRMVISVGELLGHKTGDNPHVWYDPPGWAREATLIAADLSRLDPSHRQYFARQKAAWLASLQPVYREIAAVKKRTNRSTVIATEPVYGYMLAAVGATSLDSDFQKAIMDGTDPSPQAVAQFESALSHHTARMLFYNSQATTPTTANMRQIAVQNRIPIIGVTETQPPAQSFVHWQIAQLQSIAVHWK